jgi:hypothetical protein
MAIVNVAVAERFLIEARERLVRFGLELHAAQTRLIEFGRFAASNRDRRGGGKPETFDFVGFTRIWGKTRGGKFTVIRQTRRKGSRAELKEVKAELRRRRHDPTPEQGAYLCSVVGGRTRYYGVPMDNRAIAVFRPAVGRMRCDSLRRRSQRSTDSRGRAWSATLTAGSHPPASAILSTVEVWHCYLR